MIPVIAREAARKARKREVILATLAGDEGFTGLLLQTIDEGVSVWNCRQSTLYIPVKVLQKQQGRQ
jgi:hypothetical protein